MQPMKRLSPWWPALLTDFLKMKFNRFLLTPYFGPGLLPHEQTLWLDELAVGNKHLGPIEAKN